MAFKTASVADVYRDFVTRLSSLKSQLLSNIQQMVAGSVTSQYVFNIHGNIHSDLVYLDGLKNTAGLVAYAKSQVDDQNYDIVAEFTNLYNQMVTARDWIEANMLADENGWLQHVQWSNNALVFKQYTTGQTSTLRSVLQAVVDAIEG